MDSEREGMTDINIAWISLNEIERNTQLGYRERGHYVS